MNILIVVLGLLLMLVVILAFSFFWFHEGWKAGVRHCQGNW